MPRQVQAISGTRSLALPDGWVLNGGDVVIVSDETWALIQADLEVYARLDDLGASEGPVDEVPTWRDVQQMVKAWRAGTL